MSDDEIKPRRKPGPPPKNGVAAMSNAERQKLARKKRQEDKLIAQRDRQTVIMLAAEVLNLKNAHAAGSLSAIGKVIKNMEKLLGIGG